jgi:putative ABC transport system permease protein
MTTVSIVLGDFGSDLRFAIRKLRRAPMFTTVAITTLAVGIAAVTTLFSFANAAYLRPLPLRDTERLRAIGEQRPSGGWSFSNVYGPAVKELIQPTRSFERVTTHQIRSATVLFDNEAVGLLMLAVDTSFVPMFQVRPTLGRLFSRDEILGDAQVAVISDTLWKTRFGMDSSILGKSLALGDRRYSVIGVMQRGFRFPRQTDVWVPLPNPVIKTGEHDVSLIAKLRGGVTTAAAQAELDAIAVRVQAAEPRFYKGVKFPLRDEALDRRSQQFMPMPSLFLGAAFLVLLVACSNVANLFLARAGERRGEMAVRGSLGASRWRLIKQVLTESLVLGIAGSAIGTLLSVWLVKLALSAIPQTGFPFWLTFALDLRVLGFSVAVALLVTVVVGLTPAREGTRVDLVRALKTGGDGGGQRSGVMASGRRGLVIQLTFAVVLFVGAALLVRTYLRYMNVDLGYPAEKIVTVMTFFDRGRYKTNEDQMRLIEGVMPRVATLPGARVTAARGSMGELRRPGRSDTTASGVWTRPDLRFVVDGDTISAVAVRPFPRLFTVTDNYFEALDLRIQRGRSFAADDVAGSTPVLVVSRQFARVFWKDANPIGHRFQWGTMGQPYEVVGVVDDVRDLYGGRNATSNNPLPYAYVTARQNEAWQYAIHVRTDGDVATMHAAVSSILRAADPLLIIHQRERTMASQIENSLLVTRIFGGLLASFAGAALVLAVIGVYGLVAYGVSQRTREIGVRIALGGTTSMIVGMFMREGLRFVLIGIAAGLLVSTGVARMLTRLLFGVSPLDPVTYLLAAVLFGSVALLACYLPARRAARVDALVALRAD